MVNKISVIIPTIQKKIKVLTKLVKLLETDESVTEIFIINNLPESPLNFEGCEKVKIYTPSHNLYVNQSWNFGIAMIENENFVLMNDDMLPCNNFVSTIVNSPRFNFPNTGIMGVSNASIKNIYTHADVDDIEQPACDEDTPPPFFAHMKNKYMETGDWGIAIFGKKQNYYPIPKEYKVLYGDNYLLYKNVLAGKKNYEIVNLPVVHLHSSSSLAPEAIQMTCADINYNTKHPLGANSESAS